MQWKEEYAVGIGEIDDQHKTLIVFIADFERAVEGKAHWNTVQPLIARAREFVKFHFAVEESLMQIVKYPGFAAHRDEHQYVLEQLAALEHRVLRQEDKGELLKMLHAWLFQHIIDCDKPFARYAIDKHSDLACA
jgi:hemerythrin